MAARALTVVLTADDFGLDQTVNAAIATAMSAEWVTHGSLLANMPHAAEACELARRSAAHERIGLHLNLSQGVPMSEPMRASSTFCRDGVFLPVEKFPRYRFLSTADRDAVSQELRAQLGVMKRLGIKPSHLDSHNDVHLAPSIARLVVDVARAEGVPRVRISRNCGTRLGVARRVHHRAYNLWLERRGLRGVDYRGFINDVIWLVQRGRLHAGVRIEVLLHPRPTPSGAICDAPWPGTLEARVTELRRHLASPEHQPL
ncbi:MAG: ChbG/HpnK family deacetylase [Vicinamibacterales bacterium]